MTMTTEEKLEEMERRRDAYLMGRADMMRDALSIALPIAVVVIGCVVIIFY